MLLYVCTIKGRVCFIGTRHLHSPAAGNSLLRQISGTEKYRGWFSWRHHTLGISNEKNPGLTDPRERWKDLTVNGYHE